MATEQAPNLTSAQLDEIVAGRTLASLFVERSRASTTHTALRWRSADETFEHWTFAELADRVARMSRGLAERGVAKGDRVVLMFRNVPEFHVADLAVCMLGATPVSIYNSSSPEQIQYLVDHAEAKVALLEDVSFLARFEPIRSSLATLRTVGIQNPAGAALTGDDFVLSDTLQAAPLDLDEAAAAVTPEDLATIIYTSGTTGPPKGVMISHHNVAWTLECLTRLYGFDSMVGKELVSYLPMAHIAERMVGHYQMAALGTCVTTCPDPGDVATYLREVHPNFFFGVPRVWEKLYAGIHSALAVDPARKEKFEEAVAGAIPIVDARAWGRATLEQDETWRYLDEVAFATVRKLIGLDEVDLAMTGAAPIPAEMLSWFRAIGIPLAEIYGMSESCGPMTFSPWRVKAGSVGQAIPGCEVRIAEDGEVICRGGNVFGGYLKAPDKTAESLDEDGWLHSGDIGEMDEDGYFRIVDRKKELIITAGGKNISPANLESRLKMIPLVGQACAIGDGRPFVSALVVLDPEAARSWAAEQDLGDLDLAAIAAHPKAIEEIEAGVTEAMAEFNQAERVKRVAILHEEWLPDSECLTPTSKLKRRGIHARFAEEIEKLYS